MGIINGVLGKMRKSAGDVVFQKSYGKNVFRSKPVSVRNPKTDAQMAQRQKMTLIQTFLRMILSIIRIGYKQRATTKSAFAAAMSYNLKNAVTGVYPNQEIDYSNVKIASGTLLGLESPVFSVHAGGDFSVVPQNNSGQGNALATDKLYFVVYNRTEDKFYTFQTSTRQGPYSIDNTVGQAGDEVYGYAFYVSADNSIVSDSVASAKFDLI